MSISNLLRKVGVYLLVFVVWILLRRNDLPYTFEHSSDVYLFSVIFLYITGKYIGNLGMYKTAHFTGDGARGSCSMPPVIVYPWALFRVGGIDYPPLKTRGNEMTAICHISTLDKVGENFVSTARFKPIEKDNIPCKIMEYIDKHNYPTEKIYLGYATRKLETSNPEFIELEEELNEANSVNNTLKNAMRGKFETIEGAIKGVERMGKSIRGKKKFTIFHKDDRDDED